MSNGTLLERVIDSASAGEQYIETTILDVEECGECGGFIVPEGSVAVPQNEAALIQAFALVEGIPVDALRFAMSLDEDGLFEDHDTINPDVPFKPEWALHEYNPYHVGAGHGSPPKGGHSGKFTSPDPGKRNGLPGPNSFTQAGTSLPSGKRYKSKGGKRGAATSGPCGCRQTYATGGCKLKNPKSCAELIGKGDAKAAKRKIANMAKAARTAVASVAAGRSLARSPGQKKMMKGIDAKTARTIQMSLKTGATPRGNAKKFMKKYGLA